MPARPSGSRRADARSADPRAADPRAADAPFASSGAARPLVISRRSELLDVVLRLAAAAGAEVEVACDLGAAGGAWASAPLVLVDDAALLDGEGAAPARRSDIVVVGGSADDATVWRRAVRVGAEHVVFLPDAEGWLVERFGDVRDGPARAAHVVAVVGGRGGGGATTVASALAVTAVDRGSSVLLVDLDPLGGGIDLVLGVEGVGGLRWPDLAGARGRLNGASLCDALPRAGELPVLSWDRGSDAEVPFEAACAVVDASVRVCDVVVFDLPRSGGAAAALAAGRAAELLVVVPAEVRAVAAAERVLRIYRPLARSVRAVVRGPSPSGLSASSVCEALGVELAGELRPEPRLAQLLDRGEAPARRGRGPLAQFCGELLADAGR